jgi:phosphoribosylformylglycinamidine cyclo-ligase
MEPTLVESIVEGVARACKENGIALIGGETAEMPGIYRMGEYDVAGFITGVVEKKNIIEGSKVAPGQAVVGLASSGPHTNGYSLIRKVLFDQNDFGIDDSPEELQGLTISDAVLAEHRSYLSPVRELLTQGIVYGMAHITGGGIPGNLVRVLPPDTQAVIDVNRWPYPPVFSFLQSVGHVEPSEMFRVFNMGIGYVLITDHDHVQTIADVSGAAGIDSYLIGEITSGPRQVRLNIAE